MSHQSCANCLYFWEEEGTFQACRRNAPRPIVLPLPQQALEHPKTLILWPPTRAERWCGEWKAMIDVAAVTKN